MARRTAAVPGRSRARGVAPGGAPVLPAAVVAVLLTLWGLLAPAAHATPWPTTPAPTSASASVSASASTAVPGTASGLAEAAPHVGGAASDVGVVAHPDEADGPGHEVHGPGDQPGGTLPRLYAEHSGTRHAAPPPGATAVPVPVAFTPPVGWRAPPPPPLLGPLTCQVTPYSGRAPPQPDGN